MTPVWPIPGASDIHSPMGAFQLQVEDVAHARDRAERLVSEGRGVALADDLEAGEPLSGESLAALLLSEEVETGALLELAARKRPAGGPQLETFSPLYISNECDAECAMCGMRSGNAALRRETAPAGAVRDQLDILWQRGIRSVAILTGEYRHGSRRRQMLARSADAVRDALDRGFQHVLINVGSLETEEYAPLLDGIERRADGRLAPHVTMCTFQEAYAPEVYRSFMGEAAANPRSDYARRLINFDRAADAGMRSVNPGILLGLSRDLAGELFALASHVEHLLARDLQVYISLPRLKKANGTMHRRAATDDELFRVAALLAARFPAAKVVISTREAPEIQQRLLPVMGVLTAGSPGVAPYDASGARFDLEASQFEVADQRPFEAILGEALAAGAKIDGYEPRASAPTP